MSKSRWDQTGLATAIGLMAPICWGMSVGLVRGITEGFGMAQGQFLMYCIAVTFLFFLVGLPDFRTMNRKYLYFGIPTATASGLTFVLAIFTSSGGAQTLEVGMVNYLWPSLTILFAVLFNGVRARWWLWLGVTVAIVGIMRILGGDAGLSWNGFCERFTQNPISYVLALAAAVTWAGFSSMTKAWGAGHNPSTVIFSDRYDDLRAFLAPGHRNGDGRRRRHLRHRERGGRRGGAWRRLRLLGARDAARQHHATRHGFVLHAGALVPFRRLLDRRGTLLDLLGRSGARDFGFHSVLERHGQALSARYSLRRPTVPSVTRSLPPKSLIVRTAANPACRRRCRHASP